MTLLVKVVALKIDTVAVPELLREMMLWSSRDAVTEPRLEFFLCPKCTLKYGLATSNHRTKVRSLVPTFFLPVLIALRQDIDF